METYDVVILTPGFAMDANYVSSLLNTTQYLSNNKISWKFINGKSSLVSMARERCLFSEPFNRGINQPIFDGALSYKKMFWIDSDIKWEVKDFMNIFESDKDVISGSCVMSDDYHVAIYSKIGSHPLHKGAIVSIPQSPQKIEACGMGFMMIRNGVLENIERPWFGDINIDLVDENGNKFVWVCGSEDIALCERIRRAGFNIWVDPTVRVGHIKQRILKV